MSNVVSFPTNKRPSVREAFSILREQREPQIEMAELVAASIATRQHAIIEAGTGTGKSFGYLIPVVAQGKRAIVATFTIALQEQLVHHDIPFLQQAMRERFGINFRAAMLKGASNYLCRRRFEEAGETIPGDVWNWCDETTSGDLTDAPEMEAETRDAIRIDLDDCGRKKCPFYERCHYQVAKAKAKAADVLIVNHKLFSMSLENEFLLDLSGYDVAIVDEAHQWEDVARDSMGGKLSPGMLSKFFTHVEKELVDGDNKEGWKAVRDDFRKAWAGVIKPWLPLTHADGSPFLDDRLLIPVDQVRARCDVPASSLEEVSTWVRSRLQDEPEHNKIGRRLDAIKAFFAAIQAGDVIAVAERKIKDGATIAQVTIETFPLFVGDRLKESLYGERQTACSECGGRGGECVECEAGFVTTPGLPVIYTSATISAGGDFTLAKQALGLEVDTPTAEIESPFDYPEQSLLYVPDGGFDPRERDYMYSFTMEAERLLAMSQGRAFLLFTSNRAMRDAFQMRRHRFPSRWQEPGVNKNALIQWFKETPNAVLYATASFWEGVSIEGDQLSLVVIDKIPFPPPSDPIYQAKGARLGTKKEFFALSVPSAIIKLKQGFGRLIRTQSDRGVVAILDSRIHGKGYGRQILRALPPARLVTDLADTALVASYLADQSKGQLVVIESDEQLAEVLDAAEQGPDQTARILRGIDRMNGTRPQDAWETRYQAWEATF